MTATTDKASPNIIASILEQHGVCNVVISPGSRNTPIVVAMHACTRLQKTVIVDERSAAYAALGMSQSSGMPTAIVCTSGTALLNYAPAIAEAYYQGIPLIVISADRPAEWIDQDDSQTIHQQGALHNFVKREYELPAYTSNPKMDLYVARSVNEAFLEAISPKQGPVHINVCLDEPLGMLTDYPQHNIPKIVNRLSPKSELSTSKALELATELQGKKIMIVAGFGEPDNRLNRYLSILAQHPGIIILAETVSNLHIKEAITNIDAVLSTLSDDDKEQMRPDVVISFGGAIISRLIKQYLRSKPPQQNWRIGIDNNLIDCFLSLSFHIEMLPCAFFAKFAHAMLRIQNDTPQYNVQWQKAYCMAMQDKRKYVEQAPWSDMRAFDEIMRNIPKHTHLQISNGTAIRYAQLFDNKHLHTCRCNRGVSGIDGCSSTAVGAAIFSKLPTILISGDLSFNYDISAMAICNIPSSFRAIVLNNSGGGIFRFISSTSSLDICEKYFATKPESDLSKLTDAFGFRYFRADNLEKLKQILITFFKDDNNAPALLEILTPPLISAEVLKNYFKTTI